MGTKKEAPRLDLKGKYFGSPKLAALREATYSSWVKQSQAIRKPLAGVAEAAIAAARDVPLNKNGRIPAVEIPGIRRKMAAPLTQSFGEVDSMIGKNVGQSVRRGVDQQIAALREQGLSVPSSAELSAIRARHETGFRKETFFGATYDQRLTRVRKKTDENITNQLRRRADSHDVLARRIQDNTTFSTTKSSRFNPIPSPETGGSARRQLERLNNGEMVRKANEAGLDVLKTAGVEFAYWRLNPGHKWEDGKEICEHLASTTGVTTLETLRRLRLDPATYDLEGLYPVDDYPDTPHPFCKCQPEPFMPPELLDRQWDELSKTEAVLDLPEEALSCSSGETEFNNSVSSFMNGFATEFGFDNAAGSPLVFNQDVLAAFGPDGLSEILASRLRRTPKKLQAARQAVSALVRLKLPEIEEKMLALTKRMNKDLRQLTADELLGSAAKSRATAVQVATIKKEIMGAQAEMEAVLSMQRGLNGDIGELRSRVLTSREAVIARARRIGLRADEVTINRLRGSDKFWMEISKGGKKRFEDAVVRRTPATRSKAAQIKKGIGLPAEKSLRGKKAHLGVNFPGYTPRPFELFDPQVQAIALIEDQKGVIAHLAPGAGKTPTALTSVTDLAAKGKIKRAVLSSPASIRQQFATEMLKFGDERATITFVVPSGSSTNSIIAKMTEELTGEYAGAHPTMGKLKKLKELRGLAAPTAEIKKDIAALEKWATTPAIQDEMSAIQSASRKQAEEEIEKKLRVLTRKDYEAALVAGDPPDSMITVLGHDDLAGLADIIPAHYDYVGIDEVHQMTRQSATGGAYKANQLQKLTGGRLQYKVAFTGTAVKNNLGELWDIAEWVQPGRLPPRPAFESAFEVLTLESPALNGSVTKTLRRMIDDFTLTVESPIKEEGILLNSGFFPDERLLKAEVKNLRRTVEMTDHQKKRTAQIERTFDANVRKQEALRKKDPAFFTKAQEEVRQLRTQYGVDLDETAPKEVKKRMRELMSITNPRNIRDNDLFGVIHGEVGMGEQTAKIIEVRKIMKGMRKEGRKTIIHLERLDSADELERLLKVDGLSVDVLSGSTPASSRADMTRRFNSGGSDVLIVTRAGSTGLNLQKASHTTIHLDIPQTFAELQQRDARNWRTKQTHSVDSFAIIQDDVFLETERLRRLEQKRRVLLAVDELGKLDASGGDPTVIGKLLTAAEARLGTTYNRVLADKGRDQARAYIEKLCKKMALLQGDE